MTNNGDVTGMISLADDRCVNQFTPQQAARMHCYVDLKYATWRGEDPVDVKPVLPYAATLVQRDNHHGSQSVTIAWLPPFGNQAHLSEGCADCNENGVFGLYATSAYYYSDSTRLEGMAFYATGERKKYFK